MTDRDEQPLDLDPLRGGADPAREDRVIGAAMRRIAAAGRRQPRLWPVVTAVAAALALGFVGGAATERFRSLRPELAAMARTGSEEIRRTLAATDAAFAEATARDRLEGWLSYFAPDGALRGRDAHIVGHPALRERMAPLFADPSFTLSWEMTDVAASTTGSLGCTVGQYEMRAGADANALQRETGSYLIVWQRRQNGDWRVVLETGMPDGP